MSNATTDDELFRKSFRRFLTPMPSSELDLRAQWALHIERVAALGSSVIPDEQNSVSVASEEVTVIDRESNSQQIDIPHSRPHRRMKSYAIGALAMATAICVLAVVLVVGEISSKPTTVPPRPASVSASWQSVTFGGLTMYAPGTWRSLQQDDSWGMCGALGEPFDASHIFLGLGLVYTSLVCRPYNTQNSFPPVYGLAIDSGEAGPLQFVTGYAKCMHVNDLSVCPTSKNYGGILVLAVLVPGRTQPVAVEIGLAGNGKVAHTILSSMRASNPTRSSSAPTGACSDTQLDLSAIRSGDQLGYTGTQLEMQNISGTPCYIEGYPKVSFGDAAGGKRVGTPSSDQLGRVSRVVIGSGMSASSTIWAANPLTLEGNRACQPEATSELDVLLPGSQMTWHWVDIRQPGNLSVCTVSPANKVFASLIQSGTQEALWGQ